MLRIERLLWAKCIPYIGVCPDREKSVLVVTMKTIERQPGGVAGLRVGHDQMLQSQGPGGIVRALYPPLQRRCCIARLATANVELDRTRFDT